MLLLDYAYDLPYLQIINSNNIGIAIMQGLSGSFGIVLAVPITVLLAVAAYTGGGARAEGKQDVYKRQPHLQSGGGHGCGDVYRKRNR